MHERDAWTSSVVCFRYVDAGKGLFTYGGKLWTSSVACFRLKAENIGLKEELSEMRVLITSLNTALTSLETKVTTVSATVELLQSEPSIPKAENSTAATLNRPESHQTNKAPNADATQRNSGRSGRGHRGSRQRNQQSYGSQSQDRGERVQVQGKRRIWGTLKACSSNAAMQTIQGRIQRRGGMGGPCPPLQD